MAELVDALDSNTDTSRCTGSSPVLGTSDTSSPLQICICKGLFLFRGYITSHLQPQAQTWQARHVDKLLLIPSEFTLTMFIATNSQNYSNKQYKLRKVHSVCRHDADTIAQNPITPVSISLYIAMVTPWYVAWIHYWNMPCHHNPKTEQSAWQAIK